MPLLGLVDPLVLPLPTPRWPPTPTYPDEELPAVEPARPEPLTLPRAPLVPLAVASDLFLSSSSAFLRAASRRCCSSICLLWASRCR